MRKLRPGSVVYHSDVEAPCMRPGAGGGCAQLERGRCGIHARFGAEAKPVGCRRFPYGLVNTPYGGRVTTEHRCPCRTLGERPPLDVRDAEVSLRDQSGRLEVDEDAPQRVALRADQRVSFERYAAIEADMRARLLARRARRTRARGQPAAGAARALVAAVRRRAARSRRRQPWRRGDGLVRRRLLARSSGHSPRRARARGATLSTAAHTAPSARNHASRCSTTGSRTSCG